MTKTFCDRCNDEITSFEHCRVKISVGPKEMVNGDYCESCRYDIVHSADPLATKQEAQ